MSDTTEQPQTEGATAPETDDLAAVLSRNYDAQVEKEARETGPNNLASAARNSRDSQDADTTANQPRDDRGRFTAREQAADGAAAPADTQTTDQPEAKAGEAPSAPIAAPQSWSDAEKAHWNALSREVQETILRRERDIERGLAERATEQRSMVPLRDVLTPYTAKHAMMGMTDAEAVRRLLAAQDALERDPDRAFPALAQAFGYDLRRLLTSQPAGAPVQGQQYAPNGGMQPAGQQFYDPRVTSLMQQIEQQQASAAFSAIDAFARDGNHPHFDAVRNHMGALLEKGLASSLQDAYDQATWSNAAVRDQVLADREQAAKAQREQEAKQRAEAARRANVSVAGRSPGGTVNGSANLSLAEELSRHWDASTGVSRL